MTIEGIAFVAQKTNNPIKAARLLSASEALRSQMKLTRITGHQADCDAYLTSIRSSMDETEFAATWEEGSRLTLDQAVEYAMQNQ